MILGIDAGNSEVKACDGSIFKFPSILGEFRHLNLPNTPQEFDYAYEYNGTKGFGGTLAERECQLGYSRLGDTKANQDVLIRVLLACSRYKEDLKIVVGQPISTHTDSEKEKIINMLKKQHEIVINGKLHKINIVDVIVAVECASVLALNPNMEDTYIIDMGAGTINVAHVNNGQFIDKDSYTIPEGAESLKKINFQAIKEAIEKRTDLSHSKVILIGGMAHMLKEVIGGDVVKYPLYANAMAFYKLGVMKWKM
ncbi:MAG: ParM/StbA family protein [Aminipila sp.]